MITIQEKIPVQEIVNLCEALNAKSKAKMGNRHWTHDFFLTYESEEKQWRAVIANWIVSVDGEINGSYMIEEAVSTTPEEAIAQLLKSEELERKLKENLK